MQALHKWNRLQLHGLHISYQALLVIFFPDLKKQNRRGKILLKFHVCVFLLSPLNYGHFV